MNPSSKQLEIFCGTGGVGKTTLSASRAVYLALKGKRVLLMTIDPAKRLKDILSLDESLSGEIQTIPKNFIKDRPNESFNLDALLVSPLKTLQKVILQDQGHTQVQNRILQILFRPNGGMNEIMSLLEVQYHLNSKKYDSIILDTPPGKHFIEFLESCDKIRSFFDQSFIEIFQFISEKGFKVDDFSTENENKGKNAKPIKKIFKKFLSTGIKKLLDYLEKVTGGSFIEEFLNAIGIIYKLKTPFLKTIEFQENLKDASFSNWYLVTSIEHDKMVGALDLKKSAQEFLHQDSFMVINKCLEGHWLEWEKNYSQIDKPQVQKILPELNPYLFDLKHSMLTREIKLKEYARKNFPYILEFKEVLSSSTHDQVMELVDQWGV